MAPKKRPDPIYRIGEIEHELDVLRIDDPRAPVRILDLLEEHASLRIAWGRSVARSPKDGTPTAQARIIREHLDADARSADRQLHYAGQLRAEIATRRPEAVAQGIIVGALFMFEALRCRKSLGARVERSGRRQRSLDASSVWAEGAAKAREPIRAKWDEVLARGKARSAPHACRLVLIRPGHTPTSVEIAALEKRIRRDYKRCGEPFPRFAKSGSDHVGAK